MHFYFRLAIYGYSNAIPESKHIRGEVVVEEQAEFQESVPGVLPISDVKMTNLKVRNFVFTIEKY